MKPYVLSNLRREDVSLCQRIRVLIHLIPDNIDLGKDPEGNPIVLSCHILAHSMGRILGLNIEDGYFYPNFYHSWVKTRHGQVLDVYPVGIYSPPFLMVPEVHKFLYLPDISVFERVINRPHTQKAISMASNIVLRAAGEIWSEMTQL